MSFKFSFFYIMQSLIISIFHFLFGGFTLFPKFKEYGKVFHGHTHLIEEFHPEFIKLDLL